MTEIIPPLNSSGKFVFKKPISDKINPALNLTCKSVRKISELTRSNVNVYNDFYKPNDLSDLTFQIDKQNDSSIVGLVSSSGFWYYVPSSQLVTYPDATGVIYRRRALGVNLGPLADIVNIDSLIKLMSDVVFNNIGVKPDIRHIALSEQTLLSRDEHDMVEKARKAKIDTSKNVYLELSSIKKENQELKARLKQLEDYLVVTKIN